MDSFFPYQLELPVWCCGRSTISVMSRNSTSEDFFLALLNFAHVKFNDLMSWTGITDNGIDIRLSTYLTLDISTYPSVESCRSQPQT